MIWNPTGVSSSTSATVTLPTPTISVSSSGLVTATSTLSTSGYIAASTKSKTYQISSVTQATPTISVSSAGLITASATQSSSGYITSGTKSATKQLTTKAATTYTPSTSNQTISSGTYLTGTQTILGDSDLIASNIKSGVSIFNVTGSYTGYSMTNAGETPLSSITFSAPSDWTVVCCMNTSISYPWAYATENGVDILFSLVWGKSNSVCQWFQWYELADAISMSSGNSFCSYTTSTFTMTPNNPYLYGNYVAIFYST